jgi:group I intron endonuclease
MENEVLAPNGEPINLKSGIYEIINIITNDKYVGSAKDLNNRKYEHFRTLKNKTHSNIHLQRAYNKYKENSFIFRIICYCDIIDLINKEDYYFELIKPKYNICKKANSRLGMKHTEETKQKLREKANTRDFEEIAKRLPHYIKCDNPNSKIKDFGIYNKMCEDISKGFNLSDISKKYSVSYRVVLRARGYLHNISIRNHKWKKLSKEENAVFLDDYKSGMKKNDLAIKYGMNRSSVYCKIKKMEIV